MRLLSSARMGAAASVLAAAFIAACASSPVIWTTKDPAADFSAYRTFGYMEPLGTDRGPSRTLLSGWLIASSTRELQSRGLKSVSGTPDMLVNFYSGIRTTTISKLSVHGTPAARNYGSWAGYPLGSLAGASITEGTVIIDIVDRRTHQLVWQGRAEQRITEALADDLPGTIDALVAALFKDFP